MTTNDGDIDQLEAAILAEAGDDAPAWATPDDLSRMSVEAMIAADTLGRGLASHGRIRLTGDGVTGSGVGGGAGHGRLSNGWPARSAQPNKATRRWAANPTPRCAAAPTCC